MNLEPPKAEIKSATRVTGGPATPRKGPPKFKQRQTRQFKSKPPKKGVQGFGDDIPGMEGLGTGEFLLGPKFAEHSGVSIYLNYPPVLSDITVICPWEAFSHLELHELAQYGII
ncbi:Retinal rod rhodopsin-sensitive cGMP 3',5'-cyclic phosphodiesterase subunit gamma [Oryzias melastigma]|uniref:Rhodopsin-sensitive cGMP 3',5'-cyclic phosphodiesterase subunit gamma n=1 Tax=Oryzias melastigma TaxID=30732 RepID=A0A834C764_ORYME|nr:Retinal rod rhodopsin-sensitive cGMP 3',5'-cyclic phosphodiesterase subunit gamma [Oryzias melastigma]